MKRGRTAWTTRLPAATLERVWQAMDAGETGRTIFDRFNLQRVTSYGNFRRAVTERRRHVAARVESADSSASPSSSDPDQIVQAALREMFTLLAAGQVKDYVLPSYITAITKLAGSTRDQEKHEAWMQEYQAKQEAALDETARENDLTPELVEVIKSKVLGL